MAELLTERQPAFATGGGGLPPSISDEINDGGTGLPPGTERRVYHTGMWLALIAISMFFIAFTSAYIVRSGLGDDWQALSLPPLLWLNTLVLLASSATLDATRRALLGGQRVACNRWLMATVILGAAFLFGQYRVWQDLAAAGVFLITNPSSSFFYLLTASHALHLLGGLAALGYISIEALRFRLGPAKRTLVEVTAIYWHFMDGLWIYIMLLLWLWR
ncbi:MAG: cytochrome oxidase subunit III [Acidobacteria bacterium]|nr:cytochrome oxidase subunit III [Acidobacteriota bacterium]